MHLLSVKVKVHLDHTYIKLQHSFPIHFILFFDFQIFIEHTWYTVNVVLKDTVQESKVMSTH
jgi:hypothetical protein